MPAKNSSALILTTPTDREVVMTRVFDAPRHLVFDALTKAEHLLHWFGPHGWTLDVCQVDLRPGGAWRWVLRGPGGETMGMRGVYQKITPPEQLISTESFDDYPGESLNTLRLSEQNGKTTLTISVRYASREVRDAVLRSGMEKGAGETYERLAGHLSTMTQMEREVTIIRVFDAPRALLYQAWTDPQHMSQWFGPKNWTNPVCELDVKLGGAWRIVMRSPDGGEYPCGGVYREIVEPQRLVFTNIAMDTAGNHLLEGLTVVTFAEENGKTKLTLVTRAKGLVPQAPHMLAGMEAGWSQSLDKLAAKLTSAREIVITRIFNAPRELVFAAWTDPAHIGRWYGPNGFSITMQEMDVRPGGLWRFIMHGPDGTDYLNENQYLEIVKPERLVYLHGPVPKFQATVTFENENGKTRLTLRTTFATAEERDWIVKTHNAIEGGNQTLARLAEYLEVQ